MANSEIQVAPRTVLGKKVAQLRRTGKTPANVFGNKLESTSVEVDTVELTRLLRGSTRNAIINLSVDGEPAPRTVVVREVKRHPITTELLHVDFYQIAMNVTMRADVRVVLTGTSDAVVTYGGVLLQMLETIHVEALPGDIPAEFEADVSVLTALDQSLHVRDIIHDTAKVTLHTDPEVVVARVASPRVAAVETPVEAAAGAPVAGAPAAPGAAVAPPAKS
jgi:large subunit ribosomal protein L25